MKFRAQSPGLTTYGATKSDCVLSKAGQRYVLSVDFRVAGILRPLKIYTVDVEGWAS